MPDQVKRIEPSEAQLRAIASEYCSSSLKNARIVHHHCNTHAYITTDDGSRFTIRICDGPWWTEKAEQIDKFRRERFAWEALERVDGLSVPHVVAIATEEAIAPYPFLVMTYVPGTPMCDVFPMLPRSEQDRLLEELGAVTRRIHALDIGPADAPGELFRWAGHAYRLQDHIQELAVRGRVTARARDSLERLLCAYSSLLAEMDEDIVFLHGDLHFPNVILQQSDGHWHVSGLVDAELAGLGPRGREFCSLEQYSFRGLTALGVRDAFLRGYGEDYGREQYKLAYLSSELDPDCANIKLLGTIESAVCLDGLGWIDIFNGRADRNALLPRSLPKDIAG